MANLYYLLIGIEKYPEHSGMSILKGAINDTIVLDKFLKSHYCKNYNIHRKVLLNEKATRDRIIFYFEEEHLMKAGKDDIVLFYFAGHGSREKAAIEFNLFFPGGLNETLVCYDSRPNGFDLADKELAVLFHRISSKGAHVVSILDCCHSGSGVRKILHPTLTYVREAEIGSKKPRPYASYLNGYYAKHFPNGNGLILPEGKMLSISACNVHEKAYELNSNRGFFSQCLEQVLKEDPSLSYADLYLRCRAKMHQTTRRQTPQFELYGGFYPYDSFLLASDTKAPKYYTINYLPTNEQNRQSGWRINFGEIDGLSFDLRSNPRFTILDQGTMVCSIGLKKSEVQESWLDDYDPLIQSLDIQKVYQARLDTILVTPFPISLQTSDEEKQKLMQYMYENGEPAYFNFVDSLEDSNYQLILNEEDRVLIRRSDNKILLNAGENSIALFLKEVFRYCKAIARWYQLWNSQNKRNKIGPSTVEIVLETFNEKKYIEKTDDYIELIAKSNKDTTSKELSEPIEYSLSIQNHCDSDLHCTLFYFSPDYGILSFESWYQKLPAQKQALIIPKELGGGFRIRENETFSENRFKLFVAHEKIEYSRFIQHNLSPFDDDKNGMRSMLEEKEIQNDWFAKDLTIVTRVS